MSIAAESAWDTARGQLAEAAAIAGLRPETIKMLSEPQRVLIVNFPVKMDNGKTEFMTGYRVHHNHALGQIQGGTRFHPEETLEDIKALALWMTVKNSLNGLPAGGGKGGVCCDPAVLSRFELERVCRAYIRAIAPLMGSGRDFPGADIGTNAETQSWMLDEWEQIHSMNHEPSAVSGKAVVIGGSQGRAAATGLGVSLAVRETCRVTGRDIKGLRVAIQGFGKVGLWTARILEGYGASIVAVSDVKSGIYREEGLDISGLEEYAGCEQCLAGFPGSAVISNSDLLTCDCDVLIPAAVQGVITGEKAPRVKAKIVVEGANGPTTGAAEDIFRSRGVVVVPDILANGGGTVIAYLERVQGNYNYYWTEEEVHRKYEQMFVRTFDSVYRLAGEKGISLRMAAWVMALRRVEEAMAARGWI
ncbi:NAD-specific glutamate dehydrogenase [Desulfocucumis palustris]|uniref:Glutamate dehydrogenase n=1 Tax=Desulfocucumis palustris TaxID=1898651 RepID=A0A2L2X875_9FIRM|nr:Glu/Leu/Phe/Val dehydrogenase [Desulfocucumis palustris]GBF32399.1 NAD-specific glutamate dehydrogenase [Desulfocucumis palustris]